jgi:UDP-N-acetyl-D-mannosaminuronic acid dehydrogenase
VEFNTISVIGLGYIGLPTAAVFASRKVKVIGVDVNDHAVETINKGNIHIVEPDLDIVVRATVTEGYLRATTIPEPAEAFLIAVPTPFKDNHQPDLSYIHAAAETIAPVISKGNLIILESTSPVGTTEKLSEWLSEFRPDLTFPHQAGEESDIRLAHCPERVLPGRVMHELISNDRVIGGLTPKCSDIAAQLYKTFVRGDCIITNARTAEMCKLTENASRDVSIAFANELSMICEELDINVWELISLANRHPRVNILQPGPGVGGHCIAVDPWFIISKTPDTAMLMKTAREVNEKKPHWVIEQVKRVVQETISNHKSITDVKIACFGLSFKADIDDLRESPAVEITTELARLYPGRILAVEPHIKQLPANLKASGITLSSVGDAIAKADVIVMLVEHKIFKALNITPESGKHIVDTKGIWCQ